MPVHRGHDSKGSYFQWGSRGAKYHYKSGNKSSMKRARSKAARQGRAARARGYR